MQSPMAQVATQLRKQRQRIGGGDRAARALAAAGRLWEARLAEGWTPPPGSPYPWEQVRLSLAALIPGMKAAGEWLARVGEGTDPPHLAALLLAGNTPLLSWSPLAACLLAGTAVFVKMSRDETLWTHLFADALAEVDPEVASLLHLDVWPGEDQRTVKLLHTVDVVIAYGGDTTIAALRSATPAGTPFFGYGHALGIGLVIPEQCYLSGIPDPFGLADAAGFARDVLIYNQGGCLSPHAIFVEGSPQDTAEVAGVLSVEMAVQAEALAVPAVTDPGVARAVREARDLALFDGRTVAGDPALRWTVIAHHQPTVLEPPVGHGVVHVIPIADVARDLPTLLGPAQTRVTCVGVVGELPEETRAMLRSEGVSRLCPAGEMQTPPLDWPNGKRDLVRELLHRPGR